MNKIIKSVSLLMTVVLIICGFSSCSAVKIKNTKNAKIDTSNMEMVFEDDFIGTELNKDNWSTEPYWPGDEDNGDVRRGGYWDSNQVSLDGNGNLVITTEYKENGKHGAAWYTGMISTKGLKEYDHGYFEVRCKAPKAQGLWSAFWLLSNSMSDTTDGGKNGAEIDVFESPYYDDKYNDERLKETAFHTLHIDGYGDEHKSKMSPYYLIGDIYDEYHTYGVYWDEKEYIFYIDGCESWRTSFGGTPQVNEYMILSVEIAGENADPSNKENSVTWSGEIENNTGENRTSQFIVDYVKVWQ